MKSTTQEDYNKTTAKNVANIMSCSLDNHLPELEELCKTALSIGGIYLSIYHHHHHQYHHHQYHHHQYYHHGSISLCK